MSDRRLFRGASVSVLLVGLTLAMVTPGSRSSSGINLPEAPAAAPMATGDSLVANISGLIAALNELPLDERIEQVADWAVYLTLFENQSDAKGIRSALYDKTPLRIGGLEAATNFDYGPGRRVIHADGSVSLFYQANGDPRSATLARLADQVRMEVGEIPKSFHVYAYRPSIAAGALTVQREASLAGPDLFSPAFGYVERTITSLVELARWVDSTDDLTHVRLFANGRVELGGRRLTDARTWGIGVEDVAALYKAHTGIAGTRVQLEEKLKAATKPLETAWSALIDEYNSNVRAYGRQQFALLDGMSFSRLVRAVELRLGDTPSRQAGEVSRGVRDRAGAPNVDWGAISRLYTQYDLGSQYTSFTAQKSRIDALEGLVEARLDTLGKREYRRLQRAGWDFSQEPGFSLDPQWDMDGFQRDMAALLTDPMSLVTRARAIAASSRGIGDPVPVLISRARSVEERFAGVAAFHVPRSWNVRLRDAYSNVSRLSGRDAEEGGLLAFYQVREEAQSTPTMEAARVAGLLHFVEARNRIQCARYDGPMEGTRVGMNLFYTDLLAKLWTINYAGTSPTADIVGFLSYRETGRDVEPTYWNEAWDLPAVRLWFGTRPDGYASVQGKDELNFAHIGTRVYAAGSNPLRPGEETSASEVPGRALRWWDRHLNRIADYEQAYHSQNQIMKWSVASGWLVDRTLLPFLNEVKVNTKHRFDRWYSANSNLRFQRPVALVPRDRWPSTNECIHILQSEGIVSAGRPAVWSGGVSLGGARSLEMGTKISSRLAVGTRRAGADYLASSADEIVTLSKRKFAFTPGSESGRALVDISSPSPSIRMGITDNPTKSLRTLFSTQRGARGVRLETAHGEIGRLSIRRTSGGPELAWIDGPVSAERRLLDQLAWKITSPAQSLTSLARAPELMPGSGAFLVESQSGAIQVIPPGRSVLGAGFAPRAPPRAILIQQAAGSPTEGAIRFAGGSRFAALFEGGAQSVPLEGVIVPRAQALAALDQARFQTLGVVEQFDAPPDLGRLFTSRAVPQGSTPISITTGLPDMPRLTAFANRGVLTIERPAGLQAQAFNDLVSGTGVTGSDVRRILNAVDAGEKTVRLTEAAVLENTEAITRAVAGDLTGALDAFVRSAQKGSLDQAVSGFRDMVRSGSIDILSQGRTTAATGLFRNAGRVGGDADALVLKTLDDLGANRAGDAVEAARALAERGLQGEGLESAIRALRREGASQFADFVAARSGALDDVSQEVARALRLEPNGFRAGTVWDAGSRAERPIDLSQRATLAQRFRANPTNDVYVDQKLAVELDFELAPGPSLGRVSQDPRFSWVELALPELGDLRPGILSANGQAYQRVPLSQAGFAAGRSVILIRACNPPGTRREGCPAA